MTSRSTFFCVISGMDTWTHLRNLKQDTPVQSQRSRSLDLPDSNNHSLPRTSATLWDGTISKAADRALRHKSSPCIIQFLWRLGHCRVCVRFQVSPTKRKSLKLSHIDDWHFGLCMEVLFTTLILLYWEFWSFLALCICSLLTIQDRSLRWASVLNFLQNKEVTSQERQQRFSEL